MKVVKIVFGSLAGLYAFAQVVQFAARLMSGDKSAYGQGTLMGSFAGICIGLAICVVLFRSAFRKPRASPNQSLQTDG